MVAFAALAEPTRVRIVEMLAKRGSLSVAQINRHFSVSAPAISQHLKVLKEANLVHVQAQAQQRLYSLNPAGISEVEHWVSQMRTLWENRFDALDELLQQEVKTHKRKKP